jgi:hypothetical protein
MWVRHSRQATRNNFFGIGEGVSGAVKRPCRCLLTQPSEYRTAHQQGSPRHPPLTSAVHRNFTHSTPGPDESGKTPLQWPNSPAFFSVEEHCGSTLAMAPCSAPEIVQRYFSIALTDGAFGRSVDGAIQPPRSLAGDRRSRRTSQRKFSAWFCGALVLPMCFCVPSVSTILPHL